MVAAESPPLSEKSNYSGHLETTEKVSIMQQEPFNYIFI